MFSGFDLSKFIGGLIPLRMGLKILATHLTNRYKQNVTEFEIHFSPENKKLIISVPGKPEWDVPSGESLSTTIMGIIEESKKMPENCKIHTAVLLYHITNPIKIFLFYFDKDGIKKHVDIDIK